MNDRILATEAALRAATDLRRTLESLQVSARRVIALADRVADPSEWDGPDAARFRQAEWPQARDLLVPAVRNLDLMRSSAETVIRAILAAGGSGGASPLVAAGAVSLFAQSQHAPALNGREQEAVRAHGAGQQSDQLTYQDAVRKANQGLKYLGRRNQGQQRG
ncbi:MAG: hypothetical protein J2P45_18495 [Candidatus Dormibacteraeota bacterium]|nr:hypothetical protein [Candidatus Dormibacteraeota bacterium]